jgi:hypothetical protein
VGQTGFVLEIYFAPLVVSEARHVATIPWWSRKRGLFLKNQRRHLSSQLTFMSFCMFQRMNLLKPTFTAYQTTTFNDRRV